MGEHGKVVLEAALDNEKYNVLGYLDDNKIDNILEQKILGNINDYLNYVNQNIKFHIAIGNNQIRRKLFLKIGKNKLVTIIHKTASISKFSDIGLGNFIGAMVVINQGVKLGNNCIVNTGSIVEHGTEIGDNSHISYRSLIGSNCVLSEGTYIEMGETVKRNTRIGE